MLVALAPTGLGTDGDEDVEHLAHGDRCGELAGQPARAGSPRRAASSVDRARSSVYSHSSARVRSVSRVGPVEVDLVVPRDRQRSGHLAPAVVEGQARRGHQPEPTAASATSSSGAWSASRRVCRAARAHPVRTTSVTGRRASSGTSADGTAIPGWAADGRPEAQHARGPRSTSPMLAALASEHRRQLLPDHDVDLLDACPAAASAWATSAVRPITRADRRVDSSCATARRKKSTRPASEQGREGGDGELAGRGRRCGRPAPGRSRAAR